jgi:diguanylate cyclase (GGDEF)-like protein
MESLRSDFHVLIVDSQIHILKNYQSLLEHAGYKVETFFDSGRETHLLLEAIRRSPPHVIIFGSKDLDREEPIFRSIRQLSKEIQICVLTGKMMLGRTLQMVEQQKINEFLALPLVSPLELTLRLDQVCLRLYYEYENEQLRESSSEKSNAAPLAQPLKSAPPVESLPVESQILSSLERSFERLSLSRDPGQALEAFLRMSSELCHGKPVVYFKFLPHHFSFVYSTSVHFPNIEMKNIGIDLRLSGLREPSQAFAQISHLPELRELFSKVLKVSEYQVFPHFAEGEGLGFFAVLGSLSSLEILKLHVWLKLFSLYYEKTILIRQKSSFEVRDPVTSLYSLSYFEQKLKEEVSRARRLSLPLSLISLSLDRFEHLQTEIGLSNSSTILKMVAVLLKKTSRVNDLVAQYDRSRMLLLLPHTDHSGAEIKADRLRSMISGARFPLAESHGWGAIKVSFGVSEYPRLASDGESLMTSAVESLSRAQAAGGDRVTLAKVASDFKADYLPRSISTFADFAVKDRSQD